MRPLVSFFTAAAATGVVMVGTSLLWPRFTNQKRPEVLQAVHDTTLSTGVGKEAAKVLGVDNEETIKPLSVNQLAASVSGAFIAIVAEKTKEIVATQVSTQIVNQYMQLPQPQKTQVQELICKPKE